ncbi:1-(5-phosphoribosyl)-5-[(5-phosphoribosylamino)methylideneamino]imidazole-4-carboxamide isomerase [Paraferrimonas sedimenticola]|uniref:1-(5-phosphoribosyl)-5-[(5-phosphoribosylamino)methylideneamino] imidazole-4-carboxamide isomerase n=1 Tax=Paraferrimonas sedimenticola TaxID=375674 RepID=A0AA37RXN2_9GAMM|nr:1-(5-phosphoribosyl)-5-[(5-phosphoribosylamino)methylideneamino]imidazole-4-carboxamide isomerase [Paraferrimonas sedimenticola]GLP96517.1 1-(5-phosphoribosyl)-5-[(5-phosphoribosylamino) methylideneamino] imidazole-4-carboxamide isomerase [Paraferrimonas sedimenticola]
MIIAALDLIDGNVVRLYQGDYQQKTEFSSDPVARLADYDKAGAAWLHIVDLDGAKDPKRRQNALIAKMLEAVDAKVQVGGGIRSEQDLQQLFDIGVSRAVVGSLAVRQPEVVQDWFKHYGPEKICLALDVNIDEQGNREVAVSGWQQGSGKTLESVMDDYLPLGLKHVLVTDISRDGTLKGANTELYQSLAQQYPQIDWQASGGIAELDDIKAVKDSGASSIIVGKALLINQFSLAEAIECWPNA